MSKIKRIIILLLIIGSVFSSIFPQSKNIVKTRSFVKLDKTHPSIYISFEKFVKATTDQSGVKKDLALLRLHNNSHYEIFFDASGGNKYGEVSLYYATLDENGNVKYNYPCTVCSEINLSGGKSVSFTVPLEEFDEVNSLQFKYSYKWETFEPKEFEQEPSHYVLFYTNNLKTIK